MLSTLFYLLFIFGLLAVGFARQEEQTVKVPLKESVTVRGVTYHPTSKGREMPISHAQALGFGASDFLDDEPEEEEDTSKSKSEGDSEKEGLLKRNELRHQALKDAGAEFIADPGLFRVGDIEIDIADINKADDEDFQKLLEAVKQENASDSGSEVKSEGEQEEEDEKEDSKEGSDEQPESHPLPKDTPEYDSLIKDERFATMEALLENQNQLTEINGIAEKTKAKIVDHVKSKLEG